METSFLNEHLLPGKWGQFFVILSFVSSLFSALAYLFSSNSGNVSERGWLKTARSFFWLHLLSVIAIFSTLFYIIFNHYFEYHYAWAHSSRALPFKYLLSCFWEGQEGSFLLWTFWHAVLGIFVMRNGNRWEAPVMTLVAFVQVFLASTVLGIHFGDMHIGSTPFILLRDQMSNAPIFQQPNYLSMIQDGNGLNPLLQNYWMVIHPPILFLGFSATLFPFAYSVAALWKNDYQELQTPLLRWSLLTGMVLGTGIMMGGAWAYESLNFGGYWAWDPVENASLVPWLVAVAGLHTTIIYKSTGFSLRATFLFFIFSFILVLYSTFLTRTGILGETSVHAFTGEGESLFYHLLIFIFVFLALGMALFAIRYKKIPDRVKEEEALGSREFWMFIGALILMISVIQITYTTSMPVWNKMFGTKLAITDPVNHYNKIQVWIVILILLLTASIYYLKFKQSNLREVFRKLLWPLMLSVVFTVLIAWSQNLQSVPIVVFLFSALFGVLGNLFYLIRTIGPRVIKWGGTTAHLGFGLMMVGILFSGYNKEVISVNRLGVEFDMGKENAAENKKESRENVLLFRGIPVGMSSYQLTYMGDTVVGPNHYYKVRYQKLENDTGRIEEEFILEPNAQINPKMGLISSPDTRHYLTHDIFTYVTSTVDKSKITDSNQFKSKQVSPGDSIFVSNGYLIFKGFNTRIQNKNYQAREGDIAVAADLEFYDLSGKRETADPVYYIRERLETSITDTLAAGIQTRLVKIIPDQNAAEIEYRQASAMDDYIIMKAIKFPFINVLWLGTVLMVMGFGISLIKRFQAK
ncbi:MAG: cytochrome c biogenesis protein CcsA [Chitinophagaceae bacterium]|nr:cytochrome c biogenesis protein CcsA [Chitinophagaceae bacterium]